MRYRIQRCRCTTNGCFRCPYWEIRLSDAVRYPYITLRSWSECIAYLDATHRKRA